MKSNEEYLFYFIIGLFIGFVVLAFINNDVSLNEISKATAVSAKEFAKGKIIHWVK